MKEIKWLFLDMGSTFIDVSQCDEWRIKETLAQDRFLERKDLVRTMALHAYRNSSAYQCAAEELKLEPTPWHRELEQLYPNVKETLEWLKNKYRLGIIENREAGTEEWLEDLQIRRYFDLVITSGEVGFSKPDVKIFNTALLRAGCLAEEAVMVGDSLAEDIMPAQTIGMQTIWVRQSWGGLGNISLLGEKPDGVIDSFEDLVKILK